MNNLKFLKMKLEKAFNDVKVNASEGYIVTPKAIFWVVTDIPLIAKPGTYCIQSTNGERIPHITEAEIVKIIKERL